MPEALFIPFVRDTLNLSITDLYTLEWPDLQRELAYASGKALALWCHEFPIDAPVETLAGGGPPRG